MKTAKFAGLSSFVAGVLMIVSGAFAWGITSTQLASEKITVAEDAASFQGQAVTGPLTAFAQAEVVKKHTMEASGGLSYAELGAKVREAQAAGDTATAEQLQQTRNMVETGNFVRASLFTSVMAFGVSALVMGAGLLFSLVGWALYRVYHRQQQETAEAAAE
ncbi:MAG: aromatic ring-opening dioxygenase LigA [Propionibacteriaceae bacterium]|nr:aromatic ring-opening dioxygenase LigA [Propionibacteriaceae bacterium]